MEGGQDLLLGPEPAKDVLGVEPAPDHLERYVLAEDLAGAGGQVDLPHPTPAEGAQQLVGPHVCFRRHQRLVWGPGNQRRFQKRRGLVVRRQQTVDLLA